MNQIRFQGVFAQKLGFFVLILSILLLPTSAEAFFHANIVEKLFGNSSEQIERGFNNSQTASVLQAAVNPDPNPSKGGGDIITDNGAIVPDSGPSGTLADIEEAAKSDQISIYVVLEGDSLSQIAKMFDVSTRTLMWANDIDNRGIIREGQTLVILPVSGLQYTIKKGDSLKSIAKKYKGDAQEIQGFNDIPADGSLVVGDTIVIPGGSKSVSRYVGSPRRSSVRGSNAPSYEGYYIRPIVGGRKSQSLHGWNAVDLAVARNTPIVAAASGTVKISRSGWNGGYGTYIVIDHPNGTQTLYSHNNRNIVSAGQWVVKGQVIGYIGSTGRSTGPHVHFEVRGAKNPF